MRFDDGISILNEYYNKGILNKSMLDDVSKTLDTQTDYNMLITYGIELLSDNLEHYPRGF